MCDDIVNPLFKACDLVNATHIVKNNEGNFIPKYVPGQGLQGLYYILLKAQDGVQRVGLTILHSILTC